MSIVQALEIMEDLRGNAIDGNCLDVLKRKIHDLDILKNNTTKK